MVRDAVDLQRVPIWIFWLTFAVGLALLLSPSLSYSGIEADKLTPSLRSRLAVVDDSEEIRFSVMLRDDATKRRRLSGSQRRKSVRARTESVLSSVPQWHRRGRLLENVAGFSGRGDRAIIERLASHPSVERVYLDLILYPLMAEGVPLVGADQAAVLGVTGGRRAKTNLHRPSGKVRTGA